MQSKLHLPYFPYHFQAFNFSTVPSTSPDETSNTGILFTLQPAIVNSRAAVAIAAALFDSKMEIVTILPCGSSTPGNGLDKQPYIAKIL